jgi:hypothetical protein
MKYQLVAKGAIYITVMLFLIGCAATPTAFPSNTPALPPTWTPTVTPETTDIPTLAPTWTPIATLNPTQEFFSACVGWNCSLEGIVYVGSPSPGNQLEGIAVHLSQISCCSPTSGEHKAITGEDGTFAFAVYLHDTDTFLIKVQADGYEPVDRQIGGFDCLYCSCPPIEIVLQPAK